MSLFRRRLLLNAGNTLSNSLIARYTCYDKTNEDEDRDVLKDLSGNGRDIKLYNFTFSENSGYGEYGISFLNGGLNNSNYGTPLERTYKILKYNISINFSVNQTPIYIYPKSSKPWKLKADLHGAVIKQGNVIYADIEPNCVGEVKALTQEQVEAKSALTYYPKIAITPGEVLTLEQIPYHQGALVSDGVDDYGLCNNFPIILKEYGYTVLAIRRILKDKGCFLSNRDNSKIGAFGMELYADNMWTSRTFADGSSISNINPPDLFTYQTANVYNGKAFTSSGNYTTGVDKLVLFNLAQILPTQYISSIALYALEIYDKNLTEEEIALAKTRMMAEYEAKTGESIDKFLMLGDGKLGVNQLK